MAKILVIDDQQVMCDLFYHTLKVKKHDVITSNNVAEALKLIKKDKFDIIFLDVVLPEMNGLEIYKKIRETDKDVPVVMMTGFGNQVEKIKDEALKLGVYKCMDKPFDIIEIVNCIDELLSNKEG
ncbi:response regulator [Candidatus Margulisiibacteriota bacterium]